MRRPARPRLADRIISRHIILEPKNDQYIIQSNSPPLQAARPGLCSRGRWHFGRPPNPASGTWADHGPMDWPARLPGPGRAHPRRLPGREDLVRLRTEGLAGQVTRTWGLEGRPVTQAHRDLGTLHPPRDRGPPMDRPQPGRLAGQEPTRAGASRPWPSKFSPAEGRTPPADHRRRRGLYLRPPGPPQTNRRGRLPGPRPAQTDSAPSGAAPPSSPPAALQSPGRSLHLRRAPARTLPTPHPTFPPSAGGPRACTNGQIKAARAYAQ